MKNIAVTVSENARQAARAWANPDSASSAVESRAEIVTKTVPNPCNPAAINRISHQTHINDRLAAKTVQNPPAKRSNSIPINQLRQNGAIYAFPRILQNRTETVQIQPSLNRINNIQSTICTENNQKP